MARDYHHGDLRTALLRAAVELIAERGLPKLSLRECARRASVSHAAPYRHFADKDALLWAIAQDGFARLTKAGHAAMADIDDPRDRLDAYGVAYVRFAFENPVHHRVMFTSPRQPDPKQVDADGGAFDLLVAATTAVVAEDTDPMPAAMATWSLVHGLSMLILDDRVPAELVADADGVESLARTVLAQWRGPLG